MSYVGWTYEIDAEAEVIYTNMDTTNWLVDHKWSWGKHPLIHKSGRGGVLDYFTDFRFKKVLEISDRGTQHSIPVACSVRDVRFPQWDLRLSDDGVVGFLIEGVDYHPADLVCVSLQDVVMFESAGEFAMFFEVDVGKISGGFSVKVYPDPSTDIMKISTIVVGNAGSTYPIVSLAFENGKTKVFVDTDAFKYTNKWLGTDNEKLFAQERNWTQDTAGKVAIIFDDAISGGVLNPHDSSSSDGIRGIIDSVIGSLGTEWDIYNHSKLSVEQCENDSMWDQYSLVIYIDRFGSKYHRLQHILNRVRDGNTGLIILGDGNNAQDLATQSTTAVFYEDKTIIKQAIDTGWGSDPSHPIGSGVSVYADERAVRCIQEALTLSDVGIVSVWNSFVAIEEAKQIQEVRLVLHNNTMFQPKRRIYWVEMFDTAGVRHSCSRTRAKLQIIDDDVQKELDKSIGLTHDHFIDQQGMHESFVFKANTWYRWDNKLYKDLSAIGYVYGLSFPNCGSTSREVNATIKIKNKSSKSLEGNAFKEDFSIGGGGSAEFEAKGNRYEGAGGASGSFGWVTLTSPEEQEWEMEFRFKDNTPCPNEPPMPFECGNIYSVKTKVIEAMAINEDTTDRCTDFFAYVHVNPCGDARTVPVKFVFTSNQPKQSTVTVTNRDGESHSEVMYGYGSRTTIEMQCRYPTEDVLFPAPDDLAWIATIAIHCEDGSAIPKVLGTVEVKDTASCGAGGPGFSCPEGTMPDGSTGYNWNVGEVMDGEWYEYDNQDGLCGQMYDGFTFSTRNLGLPWNYRHDYRYRIETIFTTREEGQYQYVRRKRFSADRDVDMWISNNIPEVWNHEYMLMNGDYNTGGQDAFSERYAVSFRALDADALLTFNWKLRFNRERKLPDGTWVEDNRDPFEGWRSYTKTTPLGFSTEWLHTNPDTIRNVTGQNSEHSIYNMYLISPNEVPEKGAIHWDIQLDVESPTFFDKLAVYDWSGGGQRLKFVRVKDEMDASSIYNGGKTTTYKLTATEAQLAGARAGDMQNAVYLSLINFYAVSSTWDLGGVTISYTKSECTYLPYKHAEDAVPVANNFTEFMDQYPVESTRMFSTIPRIDVNNRQSDITVRAAGFYKLRVIHRESTAYPVFGKMQIKVFAGASAGDRVGVVIYGEGDVLLKKLYLNNTYNFTTNTGIPCVDVKYIDIYCLSGKPFFTTGGGSKVLIDISG